jgi:hypothetical protein
MNPFRTFALALFGAMLLAAPSSAQESDHLACLKVKDPGGTSTDPIPVTLTEIIDDTLADCVVKKAKLVSLCVRVANTAANGGNDPRAAQSAAEAYGCYKVKCGEGKPDGSISVDDALGNRLVTRTKLLSLCVPVEVPIAVP